jgi:hypothetical protein
MTSQKAKTLNMGVIGSFVFMALCGHYKNDQNEYLAIIKFDRNESMNSAIQNTGLNPHEWTYLNGDKFFDNIDLTVKPWAKYLKEENHR